MPASISIIRKELVTAERNKMAEIILKLARYKADNKAFISYLLFDSEDEDDFIEQVKMEVDELFQQTRIHHSYYFKKGFRKIIKYIDKFIRFSPNKETEVQLRLYLLSLIIENGVDVSVNTVLANLFMGQLKKTRKAFNVMHEDLQYDYREELETAEQYIKERNFYF